MAHLLGELAGEPLASFVEMTGLFVIQDEDLLRFLVVTKGNGDQRV